ncbi:glucose-6-phosphate dehydrogenase assembly protein OpcA [Alloscardovia macacae]|uniref:OpcA protein n=1 Tax=Alloscardovia macacae TaxID=1160091 RepID=A0A1Y2SXT1_9BIFI|nr:glucose-6-phosphate dehydrogenase assembly protein OpcA [Alloscardovia macacae]OTA26700.1 OpcA protein [Alloscardovia macacae]OTA29566.1 OpcA protein [Alloscardovia macacae]OZG54866.1 opcA protein [Alloscardovia macacae]
MIEILPSSTTSQISSKLAQAHAERGEASQGRVLTLLVSTSERELENVLATAIQASQEHPSRVIAIVTDRTEAPDMTTLPAVAVGTVAPLDAEIRLGSDGGAGEVIVLRPAESLLRHLDTLVLPLLVPDAPVVAWWSSSTPASPSTSLLGSMTRSRITDAQMTADPMATFLTLREHHTVEETDLAWTRLTVWRGLLAALVDEPPHTEIQSVTVRGNSHSLSVDLLGAWLAWALKVPVSFEVDEHVSAVRGVVFHRTDGDSVIERPSDASSDLFITKPGQMKQTISVPHRTLGDCMTEELRRLDPDEIYNAVLTEGWDMISHDHWTTQR